MDWKTSIQDYQILADNNSYNYWDIFCAKELSNIKPSKASVDAMDIIKLAGGICGGVLVKDYAVYKKWIKRINTFIVPWAP